MIPGKKYKPEDFIEIAWRRRWFIVLPLVVLSLGTFIVVQFLPNWYRAEATVLVIPPKVPASLIKPTITTKLEDRLQSLKQRILSRTQLERIIQDFNLYTQERKTMLPETMVDLMRDRDIDVAIPKAKGRRAEPNHFAVAFQSQNPRLAAQVTERLASLFVNANLEDRELQATSTSQFMQAQLEDAKKRLNDQEKAVEVYKRTYTGQLPSQVQANTNLMQTAQQQLQQTIDTTNKDRDRRLVLDRMIADEESMVVTPRSEGKPDGAPSGATPAQQLESARAALRNLELRIKADHPDMIQAKRVISDLEKKAEADALRQPLAANGTPVRAVSQAEATKMAPLTQMRAELETIDRRLAAQQENEKRLQALVGGYQGRIEAAPAREAELGQLTRELEGMQNNYAALLKKAEDSNLAADIEQRQIGEQFRVVDSARTPEKPISPNRLRLTLFGLLGGLALGVGFVGLLEYRDTSLRTEDDVVVALSLPVVALVPTMTTADERRRWRRRRLVLATSTAATIVISVAAIIWKLRLFETWSR